jgi:hypothetical protein
MTSAEVALAGEQQWLDGLLQRKNVDGVNNDMEDFVSALAQVHIDVSFYYCTG